MKKRLKRAMLLAVLAAGTLLRPAGGAHAEKIARSTWTRCVTAGHHTTCRTYPLKREHRAPIGKRTSCRQTKRGKVCETWPTFAPPAPACSLNPNTGPSVLRWTPIVCRVAAQVGVSPRIVGGIIWKESRGENYANGGACNTSQDGYASEGLMQLVPGTAASVMHVSVAYAITALCDPTWNVTAGATYFRECLDYWHGNVFLAVGSYNGGEGNPQSAYAADVLAHS